MSKELCLHCFNVLHAHLLEHPLPEFNATTKAKSPLFVTWSKASKSTLTLRGCLGTFKKLDLAEAITRYAYESAFKDSRFLPIALHELPHLSCTVSLLHSFEPINDQHDWDIGSHGLSIQYSLNNALYSATFLPEISHQEGWDKDQTIQQIIRKSGFTGLITKRFLKNVQFTRYQSTVVSMSYTEYKNHLSIN